MALFVDDMAFALSVLEVSEDPDELTVRRIRNHPEVEAVSLVGRSGTIHASTSSSLVDVSPENP